MKKEVSEADIAKLAKCFEKAEGNTHPSLHASILSEGHQLLHPPSNSTSVFVRSRY